MNDTRIATIADLRAKREAAQQPEQHARERPTKCQACGQGEACWAWQPFGPDSSVSKFMAIGWHYRGFPVVKICDVHVPQLMGKFGHITFRYKREAFVADLENNVVHRSPF